MKNGTLVRRLTELAGDLDDVGLTQQANEVDEVARLVIAQEIPTYEPGMFDNQREMQGDANDMQMQLTSLQEQLEQAQLMSAEEVAEIERQIADTEEALGQQQQEITTLPTHQPLT